MRGHKHVTCTKQRQNSQTENNQMNYPGVYLLDSTYLFFLKRGVVFLIAVNVNKIYGHQSHTTGSEPIILGHPLAPWGGNTSQSLLHQTYKYSRRDGEPQGVRTQLHSHQKGSFPSGGIVTISDRIRRISFKIQGFVNLTTYSFLLLFYLLIYFQNFLLILFGHL